MKKISGIRERLLDNTRAKREADLIGAKVNSEQLEEECGDETTKLPEHIKKLKDFWFKGCPKKK
jgi:hypothetical protein